MSYFYYSALGIAVIYIWIMEVGRDLRMFLVEPPAQSRLSSEVRQVAQDFWVLKPPTGQRLVNLACLSTGCKSFSL